MERDRGKGLTGDSGIVKNGKPGPVGAEVRGDVLNRGPLVPDTRSADVSTLEDIQKSYQSPGK